MDLALTKKVALVTGSHRGTGQIIVKTLLQESASVLVHGITQTQAEASIEQPGAAKRGWGDTWEAVAALIAFLCSSMADAIHGQNIRINGGQLGIVD